MSNQNVGPIKQQLSLSLPLRLSKPAHSPVWKCTPIGYKLICIVNEKMKLKLPKRNWTLHP